MKFINETLDIYSVPTPSPSHQVNEKLTIVLGDLHGNAIKLLYCLMFHGFVSGVSQYDLGKLVKIYVTETKSLTLSDLEFFLHVLAKLKFDNKGTLILLGDVLADRGSNDYFTLKLLELLHHQQIKVEILLSNHDSTFIEATELQTNYLPQNQSVYNASMTHLQELIDLNLIKKEEVQYLATSIYKPLLKALTYRLDLEAHQLIIYSHAAVGLNTIRNLAFVLEVPYRDKTQVQLAQTIDAINAEFRNYVEKNLVYVLYTEARESKDCSTSYVDLTEYPFEFLMHNRLYHHILRPRKHELYGYELDYVHGHDSGDPDFMHLNNTLGMSAWLSGGEYTAMMTHGVVLNHQRVKGCPPLNQESIVGSFKTYMEQLKNIMNAFHERGNTKDTYVIKNFYVSLNQNLTDYLEGFLPPKEFEKQCQCDLDLVIKSIQKDRDTEKVLNRLHFILKGVSGFPIENQERLLINPSFFRFENKPVDLKVKLKDAVKTLLNSDERKSFK